MHDAISNHTWRIIKELSKSFSISVYTFKFQRVDKDQRKNISINFITNYNKHDFSQEIKITILPKQLAKKLSKHDLLMITTERPPLIPIVLSKFINPGQRVIWDFHGITPPSYHTNRLEHIIELYRVVVARFLMNFSDSCIVHSEYMKAEVEKYFKRTSTVIHYGIDAGRFSPKVGRQKFRRKHNLQSDFTLLYVGRLAPHKRVDFLISALTKLDDPEIKLIIVGEGPERDTLETYVRLNGMSNKVIFAGRITDEELPSFYSGCDALVTASLHEGVCVPILEAFAAGRPVIVPDNTAMPETTRGIGLIYHTWSIKSLIDKIRTLKRDRELRSELSRVSMNIVAQHSIRKVAEEYKNYIDEFV